VAPRLVCPLHAYRWISAIFRALVHCLMATIRLIILAVVSLPAMLFGYSYVILFTLLFAAHRWRFDLSTLTLTAWWRPWASRWWRYSTVLSYGVIYQPYPSELVEQHEMVHVRQAQDLMCLSLLVGSIAGLVARLDLNPGWVFLGVWASGVAWKLPNFLGAILRGGHVYRDAEHERSAYAQTDVHHVREQSWLEDHLSRPRDW
jgi:hypothetical protein